MRFNWRAKWGYGFLTNSHLVRSCASPEPNPWQNWFTNLQILPVIQRITGRIWQLI